MCERVDYRINGGALRVGTRAEEGKKWSWDSTQRIEMKASRVAGRTEPSKVSDSKK